METEARELPRNDQVVCSLYEGDFHFGIAILINSIVRSGFRGLFWIGNRGGLPPWTDQLKRRPDGLFEVGDALLCFEEIHTGRHFGQFKSEFLNHVIDRGIAVANLWYFDPDITVRCDWTFFERWIQFGVSICQEINMGTMPSDHPLRCEWLKLASDAGWDAPFRLPERYYNSGFVGLHIRHREFLTAWMNAIRLANANGVRIDQFQEGNRSETFYTVDQDTMNIAIMFSPVPLSTIGFEGMGWTTGGFTMYHTVGTMKPWRKKFISSAFESNPPSNGDKFFLRCADGPIRPYSAWKLARLRAAEQCASLIGRFFRR